MKYRQSEYLIDRLNENIAALEDRVERLVKENEALTEECKFGAVVAGMFGIALGLALAAVISWAA